MENPGAEEDLAAGVFLALFLCDAGLKGVHADLDRLFLFSERLEPLRVG